MNRMPRLAPRLPRRLTRRLGDERGDVNIWAIMLASVAFLLAVLVVDGSAKMRAYQQADWQAGEAARYGVNAVGPRPDGPTADVAADAARRYLAAAGVTGTVQVLSPSRVEVTAEVVVTGPFSGVAFSSRRSATADLLVGVETGLSP
jgi:hypothetical protein